VIIDSSGNRRFFGVYRGTVTNSKDPQNKRRIKATVPQVLGTEPTDWAWPTDDSSSYSTPPKIGQGVWVMFEGGDPSFPIWSGTFGDYKGDGTQVELTDLPNAPYPETISNNVSSGKFDVISSVVDLSNEIVDNYATISSPTFTGTVTAPILRLTSLTAASLSSTEHAFQVGPDNSSNTIIDQNELSARNNGAVAELILNRLGGNIQLGSSASVVNASNEIVSPRIRLTSTTAAGNTSTGHAFQIGATNTVNLVMDGNELSARNNGAVSALTLNRSGGDIALGNSLTTVDIIGRIDATHYPWAVAAGSGTIAAPTALNTISTASVTFPASRFTVAPIVVASINTDATNMRIIRVSGVTTTGFTIGQWQTSGGTLQSTGFYYTATQMSSGSAGG
jgi:hypothetical protein